MKIQLSMGFISLFTLTWSIFCSCSLWAADNVLSIFVSTPPALIYVGDGSGNSDGANPFKPIDQYGEGTILQNIPNSNVQEDNESSDEAPFAGQSSPATGWTIGIHGPSATTFTIYLVGMTSGISQLEIDGIHNNFPVSGVKINENILISQGVTKEVEVNFDSSAMTLGVTQVVKANDLLQDVETACRLGQMNSQALCNILETKATDSEKDIQAGHSKDAIQDLSQFIQSLMACKPGHVGEGQPVVQQPAYSILKDDAETLLKQLGGTCTDDWDWQHHCDKVDVHGGKK